MEGAGCWAGASVIVECAKPGGCRVKPGGESAPLPAEWKAFCEVGEVEGGGCGIWLSAETCAERGAGILNPPPLITTTTGIVLMTMERMRLGGAALEVKSALLLFHNCKPINPDYSRARCCVFNRRIASFVQIKQTALLQKRPEQTALLLECLFLEAGYLYTVRWHKLRTGPDRTGLDSRRTPTRGAPLTSPSQACRQRCSTILSRLLRHLSLAGGGGQGQGQGQEATHL